jgi:lipopolysaccharide export LptBFGC system permease protein LptF
MFEQKGMSVWVTAADGAQLHEVRAMLTQGQELIAIYAPQANWSLANKGIHLECQNVQMMVRNPGNHFMSMDTERYSYLFNSDLNRRDHLEPDSMSTPEVMALTEKVPPLSENQSVYNNARLTVQFRYFLPLSLIAFSLLAMGLGLTFGTDQNLPGVVIIVVVVAAVVYPTFGYVKNYTDQPQIHPAFILWPPAMVVALIGGWMAWRPERAREILGSPFVWLSSRRTKSA